MGRGSDDRVDVILQPSIAAAANTVDETEVSDKPVVFQDVVIQRLP